MVRPRGFRRIRHNPDVTYFKPQGIPLRSLEEVELEKDELEALRLKDILELEQSKAALEMMVSQPTFHRLLLSARKKLSRAVVEGKAIRIN